MNLMVRPVSEAHSDNESECLHLQFLQIFGKHLLIKVFREGIDPIISG